MQLKLNQILHVYQSQNYIRMLITRREKLWTTKMSMKLFRAIIIFCFVNDKIMFYFVLCSQFGRTHVNFARISFVNPLSANPTKWSNTL